MLQNAGLSASCLIACPHLPFIVLKTSETVQCVTEATRRHRSQLPEAPFLTSLLPSPALNSHRGVGEPADCFCAASRKDPHTHTHTHTLSLPLFGQTSATANPLRSPSAPSSRRLLSKGADADLLVHAVTWNLLRRRTSAEELLKL